MFKIVWTTEYLRITERQESAQQFFVISLTKSFHYDYISILSIVYQTACNLQTYQVSFKLNIQEKFNWYLIFATKKIEHKQIWVSRTNLSKKKNNEDIFKKGTFGKKCTSSPYTDSIPSLINSLSFASIICTMSISTCRQINKFQ